MKEKQLSEFFDEADESEEDSLIIEEDSSSSEGDAYHFY